MLEKLTPQGRKILREIGDKITQIREEKNMRQIDVAKKGGLNANYYAKVERGESSLSVITLEKVCKGLGVKSSEILNF